MVQGKNWKRRCWFDILPLPKVSLSSDLQLLQITEKAWDNLHCQSAVENDCIVLFAYLPTLGILPTVTLGIAILLESLLIGSLAYSPHNSIGMNAWIMEIQNSTSEHKIHPKEDIKGLRRSNIIPQSSSSHWTTKRVKHVNQRHPWTYHDLTPIHGLIYILLPNDSQHNCLYVIS